ncbi:MAG: hypothetical protein Kow0074_13870 [Candidatus Zixiibacteriota bacterium]
MKRSLTIATLLSGILLLAQSGSAETRPYSKVSLFFIYNGWTEKQAAGDVELDESVFGLNINQIVRPNFEFELTGTYANAGYSDPVVGDLSLSSLNDTRFRGTLFLGDRRASATLILNLPTGKVALTEEEYAVSIGLTDNSRKYVVRRFGQGLDVGGEAFLHPKVGRVTFNIGGGYLNKGSYQLLDGLDGEYRFGSEIYGSAGFRVRSEPVSVHLNATYRMYTDDEFDGVAVYKSGPMLMLDGRITYSRRVWVSAGVIALTRDKAELPESASGELTEESVKSGRDEFLFDASTAIPLGERLRALGRVELKSVSANDYDSTSELFRPEASYTGFGIGAGYQFTLSLWGSVVGSYYTGTVNKDNDLTGLGVTAALIFRYW